MRQKKSSQSTRPIYLALLILQYTSPTTVWQRGCRDPREKNDVHMGVSLFPALVPFTTCGWQLPRGPHYAGHPESSKFNVWHRRTPQMYVVLESDPSRQGRGANGGHNFRLLRSRCTSGLLTTVPVSEESIGFTKISTPCTLQASCKLG